MLAVAAASINPLHCYVLWCAGFPASHVLPTGQGAVVGVTDFVLRRLRSFQGVASTDCTLVEISREGLEVMVGEVPEVATAMQVGVTRWVVKAWIGDYPALTGGGWLS